MRFCVCSRKGNVAIDPSNILLTDRVAVVTGGWIGHRTRDRGGHGRFRCLGGHLGA